MWQQQTLTQLQDLLGSDPTIHTVEVYGSTTTDELDEWSDLDVRISLESTALPRYFPATDWLDSLGQVYAIEQSNDDHSAVTRLVLTDLRRIDLHFVTDNSPLPAPAAPTVEHIQETLRTVANDFRFEAVLATSKIARNDLLIGAHLVLELERKCLVLAMMQRDLDLGTTQHRTGGHLNEAVQDLKVFPSTTEGFLDRIESAMTLFEKSAGSLDSSFQCDWEPLRLPINRARTSNLKSLR